MKKIHLELKARLDIRLRVLGYYEGKKAQVKTNTIQTADTRERLNFTH